MPFTPVCCWHCWNFGLAGSTAVVRPTILTDIIPWELKLMLLVFTINWLRLLVSLRADIMAGAKALL